MKTLGLAAVFLVLLCGCDRDLKHGVQFVIAPATNEVSQMKPDELQALVRALARRVDKMGYRPEVQAMENNRVSVKLSFKAVEEMGQRRTLLTKTGFFELRLVHENSMQLVRDGMVPAGYTLMHETQFDRTGQKQVFPLLISKERLPGVSGTNISGAFFTRGAMNDPQINIKFDAAGKAAFANVTEKNIGRQVAMILDGEVYSAPVVREPILAGSAVISGGNMSQEDATEMALLLQHPLPVPVRIVEERTF